MSILTGKNLGERQRELNQKVMEAANKKTAIIEIKPDDELTKTDIDVLFQIDLASRYNNSDYMIEVLKSGNSLYVTRALKCSWIYDDKYLDIINPHFMHHNIFPWMSLRMKKKTLTTISMHVRNKNRVIDFYFYCRNWKLYKLAFKFLIYATETFKLDVMKIDSHFESFDDAKSVKHYVGFSLALATAYVDKHSTEDRIKVIHQLRYLYFAFKDDYLNMIEKNVKFDASQPNSIQRLGIRISKDILKYHKHRLWNNAVLYINLLNQSMLVKYLTSDKIKKLAKLLLPDSIETFWYINFYQSYKFVLDLIPTSEIFAFLKELYQSKYKDGLDFELHIEFYNLKYYEMLTAEEQESWALLHIAREKELFGSGNDFTWYQFVRYDKAIDSIKQYVFKTPDSDKRAEIVNILVHSAKNQEDIIKLLNYYYERHVNEDDEHKQSFVDLVIATHDVYSFRIECWATFHKLLYSLDVYNPSVYNWKLKEYAMVSLIYYILNEKELSEDLQAYHKRLELVYEYYMVLDPLTDERKGIIAKYWLDYRTERLKVLLEKEFDNNVRDDIIDEIYLIWHIIGCLSRNSKECPEIALNFMKSNMDIYENHPEIRKPFEAMTEGDFVRMLKNDYHKVIENISKVKCNTHRWSFRLCKLFRKLKVYFSHDVAPIYLKYFLDFLESLQGASYHERVYRNIKMGVVGICYLGNQDVKASLLKKYAPVNRKVNHNIIDRFLYQVQKAICRLIYQAQPPAPLSNVLKYVVGDYVKFCLPMFHHYSVNLPVPRATEFIYKMINAPVSIQKHGLRLAYQYLSTNDLAKVILKVWKSTKNVSLRRVLYKSLFSRMTKDGESKNELYDILKLFTTDLHIQDHKDVFDLLVSNEMPEELRGDFIETIWQAVCKLSNKKMNLVRKTSVINHMRENINLMNREFIREYIIDDLLKTVLYENRHKVSYEPEELGDLMKAKWKLTAAYIVTGNADEAVLDSNVELTDDIFTNCMETWNVRRDGKLPSRYLCNDVIHALNVESHLNTERFKNSIPIYRCVLEVWDDYLPNEQIYLQKWYYRLMIKSRRVIQRYHEENSDTTEYKYPSVVEITDAFAQTVGKVVKGLLENKKFYHSLYSEMGDALTAVCDAMSNVMRVSSDDFKILFCGHLTRFKVLETHVFAVMLMPETAPEDWERRYENAKAMISQFDNEELRANIFKKFSPFSL